VLESELSALTQLTMAACRHGGRAQAIATLQASQLVQEVDEGGPPDLVRYKLHGLDGYFSIDVESAMNASPVPRPGPSAETRAEGLAALIQNYLEEAPEGGALILVTQAGQLAYLSGPIRAAAEAQIHHLTTGGPLQSSFHSARTSGGALPSMGTL